MRFRELLKSIPQILRHPKRRRQFRATENASCAALRAVEGLEQRELLTLLFQESFEATGPNFDSGGGFVTISPSSVFNDSVNDHFQRTNGSDISNNTGPYSGQTGSFFWGVEDTDDNGGNGQDQQSIDITGIIVSGYTDLVFSVKVAADGDTSPGGTVPGGTNWSETDHLQFLVQVDGGGYQNAIWFESEHPGGTGNLGRIMHDTNFDGQGDSTILDNTFHTFSFDITNNVADGSTVDIRILVQADTGSDEIAFDDLQINGNEIVPDTTRPTFEATRANPTSKRVNTNDVTWDITFSEPVTNVDAGDFDLNFVPGGGVSLSDAGDLDASTYQLTAMSVPEGMLQIDQLNFSSGIVDSAANVVVHERQGTNGAHRYKVDRTAPVPIITSTEPATTNASLIPMTIDFGEYVWLFDEGDVSVSNGVIQDFQRLNGGRWSFNVLPTANGTITINVANGAARDASQNDSVAATQFTITSDRVTAAFSRSNANPTTDSSISFDILFSEGVINVDATDFRVTTTGSATADATVVVSDAGDANTSTYTVTINNAAPHGTIGLEFAITTDIVCSGSGAAVTRIPTAAEVYDVVNDRHGILSLPGHSAGNVVASVRGNNLVITPDSDDNGISISSTATGDVVVAGLGGTTVNGVAEFVAFTSVGGVLPGHLRIGRNLSGHKLFSLANLVVSGNVIVYGGNEIDAIDLETVNVNGVTVLQEHEGNGFINIDGGTFTGHVSVIGGDGDNTIDLRNSSYLSVLHVNTSAGNDHIELNTVSVTGPNQIASNGGADDIVLTATDHLSTLYLQTGDSNDTVTGNDVDVSLTTYVNTGSGDDVVDFGDLHAMSTAILISGAGNDAARFLNSQFDAMVYIPIASGDNVVDLQGTTFNGATYILTRGGRLGLRIKNNTFNSTTHLVGGASASDAFMDNGTNSFSSSPNVARWDDLTNTHIDTLFANLLGLTFP